MQRSLLAILLILLHVLPGCGRRDSTHLVAQSTRSELEQMRENYTQWASVGWDAWDSNCDGFLFAALSAVGRGQEFNIEAARDSSGNWHRTPAMDCYPEHSSTFSRDMLVGLLVYSRYYGRLDLLEETWDNLSRNNWVLGREQPGRLDTRTVATPNLVGLLARSIYSMGGTKHYQRLIPAQYTPTPGYPSHLIMLQMLVDRWNGVEPGRYQYKTLDTIGRTMASNPLYLYLAGDEEAAARVVINTWPHDRLPTESDWDAHWRLERVDTDSSLQPGDSTEPHSGGDLLFITQLLLGGG